MIDISIKLNKDNKVWGWLKNQENKLIMSGHIGTHIDVYNKSEIPENYIKSRGIIIDCTHYNLGNEIGMEVLRGKEIKIGDFVIFKTGIGKLYSYGSENYIKKHHQLSFELIEYLIEKKVHFIGIDCAGIRRGKEHIEVDKKCEENKVYVVENLDLSKIKVKNNEWIIYTIWMNNPLSTGIATKVFLELKEDKNGK